MRLIHCASPAYLARYGVPHSPLDLPRHQAVHYAAPGSGRAAPWEWEEQGRIQQCPMDGSVTVNNAETYIACCLAGLGLIQIPAFDVREHLAAGELVELLRTGPRPPCPCTWSTRTGASCRSGCRPSVNGCYPCCSRPVAGWRAASPLTKLSAQSAASTTTLPSPVRNAAPTASPGCCCCWTAWR